MKALILLLVVVCVGCVTPLIDYGKNNSKAAAAIEAEIRKRTNKPTGELTKVDLEKVRHFENHRTGVTDLKPLAGLKNVGYLLLASNQITDMKPLAGMSRLDYLAISGNPITSLNGLQGMSRLRDLRIYDCQITDLSPLAKLRSLKIIWLNNNQINDISPLAGLSQLTSLNLPGNPITDDQLKYLAELKGLRKIDLRRIPSLTKAGIDKLKEALPKCSIYSDFD